MESISDPDMQQTTAYAGSVGPNNSNHLAGSQNLLDHDTKTREDIRIQQPPIADYNLVLRQQPGFVEASEHEPGVSSKKGNGKKKSAHAIEPMPIVELVIGNNRATNSSLNISPLLFLYARLLGEDLSRDEKELANQLIGGHVASIFRYKKDKLIQENGYFIFQDLRVKFAGRFRLGFTLCEVVEDQNGLPFVLPCAHIHSEVFTVYRKGATLPDPKIPSQLVMHIEAGGAKLRYRKLPTKKSKKEQNWHSSLSEVNEGKLSPKYKRGKRPNHGGSENFMVEAVPIHQNYVGVQTDPQPDMYSHAPSFTPVSSVPVASYSSMQGNVGGAANFALPQTGYNYTHPPTNMSTGQALFDVEGYNARHQFPQQQIGAGQQVNQYPTTGHTYLQGVQSVQQSVQTFQTHQNYLDAQMLQQQQMLGNVPYHSVVQQLPEQQQMANGMQHPHISQYPPSSNAMIFNVCQPTNYDNTRYEEQPSFPPPSEEDPQQQQQQQHQQRYYQS